MSLSPVDTTTCQPCALAWCASAPITSSSNASWTTEDGEFFELTSTSKCGFKIWQNTLSRYGHWLKHSEIRELLLNGEVEIKLKTQKRFGLKNENRKDYYKTAILDSEYGIKILF